MANSKENILEGSFDTRHPIILIQCCESKTVNIKNKNNPSSSTIRKILGILFFQCRLDIM
jgi:hypothetical protein